QDNLSDEQRTQLLQWVRDGGTIVVTDPSSALAGAAAFATTDQGRLSPECPFAPVGDVGRINVPGAPLYRPVEGAVNCFTGRDARAGRESGFLVARPEGRGTVIALGGPDAFVNSRPDHGDNSVLAERLLTSQGGPVTVLQPPRVGEGKKSLADLISPRLTAA